MKNTSIRLLIFTLTTALLAACNTDEGLGGSNSVEGYIYKVVHTDDTFVFQADTIPAAKTDVYIIFGDNSEDYFGDDVETGPNGYYRFDYLRKGNYTLYAYSEIEKSGSKIPETAKVKVQNSLTTAPAIYIHTGKAYGTAMVEGVVNAAYHHNGVSRGSGPGTGMRAYIRHAGEEQFFDDMRVANGKFIFQKLLPGSYQVGVESEDDYENVSLVGLDQTITITETGKIYTFPTAYNVRVAV